MSENKNRYDNMPAYITSVFNVFQMINRKAETQKDKKFKIIALLIYNYARYMAKEYDIDLKNIVEPESINLIPIFEYVSANDIEFYNFSNINIDEVNTSKKEDLERYVLSHIYYITQT